MNYYFSVDNQLVFLLFICLIVIDTLELTRCERTDLLNGSH